MQSGTPVVLATVVATSGSTYRKAGAKMLITPDAWIAGSVSGGCLESDLTATAWEKTANGPVLLTYDATADDDILWGFGLGCNGVVQIFLERIDETGGPMSYFARCFDKLEPGVVATILTPGSDFGKHFYFEPQDALTPVSPESQSVFYDYITPPLDLILFGAGHDAMPLVGLGKALGWRVTVVDKRAAVLTPERFPHANALIHCQAEDACNLVVVKESSAIVLMTHNYLQDRLLMQTALTSNAFYVGVLGPKRRSDRLLSDLRDDGFIPTPEQLERLHAPIGLDLGAESPDEIALAIVAEIQAVSRRRRPESLRQSTGPLHMPKTRIAPNGNRQSPQCGLSA